MAAALAESSKVMLLDADAQGSSQDWAESQGQRRFNFEVQRAGDAGRLLQEVRRLAADYDWATGKGCRPTGPCWRQRG